METRDEAQDLSYLQVLSKTSIWEHIWKTDNSIRARIKICRSFCLCISARVILSWVDTEEWSGVEILAQVCSTDLLIVNKTKFYWHFVLQIKMLLISFTWQNLESIPNSVHPVFVSVRVAWENLEPDIFVGRKHWVFRDQLIALSCSSQHLKYIKILQ